MWCENGHVEGRSQRAIARDLTTDRHKVKQIIDLAGWS
jgi:hypothetical protein